MQQVLEQARNTNNNNKNEQGADLNGWVSRCREAQALRESERSLRAMQRVLADITEQRDEALSELRNRNNIETTTTSSCGNE